MKKIFSYLAATAMLFAASCSNEDLGTNDANDTQVTFNLSLEGQSGTRATIGDGTTVNKLCYAVFDEQNNLLTALTGNKDGAFANGSETVSLKLAKDQDYTVVFWAQHADAPYTLSDDKKTVTINYKNNGVNVAGNDEKRDAFFKAHKIEDLAGSGRIDVVLERPFAQLNVGVTAADYSAAVASGVEITKSYAKIIGVYNTLNLLDGSVDGETTAEFAMAATPKAASGETLTVGQDAFQYLSMNYVLVGAKKNVAAEFEFATNSYVNENNKGKTIAFNSGLDVVPVERNYRTNLVGQILTGNLDFNVSIDKNFAGEHNISGIVSANDQQAFENALNNPEVHTIMLGAGKFNVELYTNITDRETLSIIGTTGTQVEFANQQVRLQLFKNFRIENCEILRMATKKWGMLVFSTGDEAEGVYTVSNCTFNGVGTQGIYINETTSGATYNIENCTFKGDFGSEGAITIATNNAQFNVNVNDCRFENIPDESHRIFLTQSTAGFFYDFNLNTDLQATTAYEIDMFAKLGKPIYANNQELLNAALQNVNTQTIMLGAGEFEADIYNGTPARESLTIIGTEGTQVKFAKQQVRMDLFKNFRIENCEILRMATKSWGMLVFGGGNKTDGVYTVSNCTFNGVGTQGIYINEDKSGATYNIENCTFNGDFGSSDGAITIQGNQNVECNVNVNGCAFATTSHRIFVTNAPTIYYDFNLNTDLKASTAYEIYMFANLGFETINLADGEYDVYGCAGKTLTLNGSKNAVLILKNDGENGCDYAFGNGEAGVGNITFNGLTINTLQNTGNYKGYAYMKGTFNNCNFVGAYSLNNANDFTFNACTFDFKNGYFWTWGANSVKFDGCTFNGNSKNILAHGYASTTITINNCNFAATEVGTTGSGDPTACVEIGPAGTNTYTINFTGTNTKSDKYAGWTRIKDNSTGHTITGVE